MRCFIRTWRLCCHIVTSRFTNNSVCDKWRRIYFISIRVCHIIPKRCLNEIKLLKIHLPHEHMQHAKLSQLILTVCRVLSNIAVRHVKVYFQGKFDNERKAYTENLVAQTGNFLIIYNLITIYCSSNISF